MVVIEDDPAVMAEDTSETTLTDPIPSPRSSPQHSPQRKCLVHFLLWGAHGCFSLAGILTVDLLV